MTTWMILETTYPNFRFGLQCVFVFDQVSSELDSRYFVLFDWVIACNRVDLRLDVYFYRVLSVLI